MKHLIKTNNEQFEDALELANVLLKFKEIEEVRVKNVDTNEEFEVYIDYNEEFNECAIVRPITKEV